MNSQSCGRGPGRPEMAAQGREGAAGRTWDVRAGMWWGAPVPGVTVASRLENSQALLCTCWWHLVIFRKAAGAQLRLGSLLDI